MVRKPCRTTEGRFAPGSRRPSEFGLKTAFRKVGLSSSWPSNADSRMRRAYAGPKFSSGKFAGPRQGLDIRQSRAPGARVAEGRTRGAAAAWFRPRARARAAAGRGGRASRAVDFGRCRPARPGAKSGFGGREAQPAWVGVVARGESEGGGGARS
jgi:hypothetical protein